MALGDKYVKLTNHLKYQHEIGNDTLIFSFSEIEDILGFELPNNARKYPWMNEKTHSRSLGWMLAEYIVAECDMKDEKVKFVYSPEETREAFLKTPSSRITPRRNRMRPPRHNIPTPSVEEVSKYTEMWHNDPKAHMQEVAINKLFEETYPRNDKIEEVIIKVAVLNDFYHTDVYKTYELAKHIVEINIDERIKTKDPHLVNEMAAITYEDGSIKNEYMFASKYCTHQIPENFPIYDNYIKNMLDYFRDVDGFAKFYDEELLDYARYKSILRKFRTYYGLDQFRLNIIDQYLWQKGKTEFPKKYIF